MTLGNLLKEVRQKKQLTAKQVLAQAGLDASLALYSQWENNRRVPTPQDLNALCEGLGLNKKLAFTLWTRAQLPLEQLKALFPLEDEQSLEAPSVSGYRKDMTVYPAAETKIIQERDIQFFCENEAAGALLMRCLEAGNRSKWGWKVEALSKGVKVTKARAKKLLGELVSRSYIYEAKPNLFRTAEGIKYVFMPETKEFEILRKKRMSFSFHRILNNTDLDTLREFKACRVNLTNQLTESQIKEIIELLQRASNEIVSPSNDSEPTEEKRYVRFVGIFGSECNA